MRKTWTKKYLRSQTVCNNWNGAINIQRYLTTNSYVFYEVANSILYNLSKPQWRVGLGAGLGVGHSYKLCNS